MLWASFQSSRRRQPQMARSRLPRAACWPSSSRGPTSTFSFRRDESTGSPPHLLAAAHVATSGCACTTPETSNLGMRLPLDAVASCIVFADAAPCCLARGAAALRGTFSGLRQFRSWISVRSDFTVSMNRGYVSTAERSRRDTSRRGAGMVTKKRSFQRVCRWSGVVCPPTVRPGDRQ